MDLSVEEHLGYFQFCFFIMNRTAMNIHSCTGFCMDLYFHFS